MSGYDNWLQSGDPANGQFVCEVCGNDSGETDDTRAVRKSDKREGALYMMRLECGCWAPVYDD